MKFAIVDAANLFSRAHHVCRGDAYTKAGMALHIIFSSLRRLYVDRQVDHIVIACEGRAWRYDYYPRYKEKRILLKEALSPKEQEENAVYYEVLKETIQYFKEKTRMTVLQAQGCEGDDFIARWVQLHPDDEHIILSGDSDLVQLIAPNVSIYDGVQERLITHDGVFNGKNEPMVFWVDQGSGKIKVGNTIKEEKEIVQKKNKAAIREAKSKETEFVNKVKELKKQLSKETNDLAKAKLLKDIDLFESALAAAKLSVIKTANEATAYEFSIDDDWHRRALFIKIIRGDTGDGILPAYMGVRYKGSSKRIGIEEAWNDRHEKGFHWNNFMLSKWEKLCRTENGEEMMDVRVIDEFQTNEMLIDLTKQPPEIIRLMDETIIEAVNKPIVPQAGIHFMRFCAKLDLPKIGAQASDHMKYLSAPYGVK